MRWLFREATSSLSLLHIIKNPTWQRHESQRHAIHLFPCAGGKTSPSSRGFHGIATVQRLTDRFRLVGSLSLADRLAVGTTPASKSDRVPVHVLLLARGQREIGGGYCAARKGTLVACCFFYYYPPISLLFYCEPAAGRRREHRRRLGSGSWPPLEPPVAPDLDRRPPLLPSLLGCLRPSCSSS
ncbi:hypothetical protein SEVIR_1G028950v4 [Setaria viridis]